MRHYGQWVKIGLNLLYYRKEQRLTQQDLADLCGTDGISRAFLQRVESGVSSCSVDTLIDLAQALKIPLYKLFEFKE
jgi:transcriptional regulator with XRE-family HTH domain